MPSSPAALTVANLALQEGGGWQARADGVTQAALGVQALAGATLSQGSRAQVHVLRGRLQATGSFQGKRLIHGERPPQARPGMRRCLRFAATCHGHLVHIRNQQPLSQPGDLRAPGPDGDGIVSVWVSVRNSASIEFIHTCLGLKSWTSFSWDSREPLPLSTPMHPVLLGRSWPAPLCSPSTTLQAEGLGTGGIPLLFSVLLLRVPCPLTPPTPCPPWITPHRRECEVTLSTLPDQGQTAALEVCTHPLSTKKGNFHQDLRVSAG